MWHRREFLRSSVAIGSAAVLTGQTATVAASWPQWRGPTRDSRAAADTAWPETLSEENFKQIWRIELGPSYSGPILSDDLVFTTETVDQKREVVTAFDRDSGAQAWQTGWDGSLSVPFFARANGSWIRSTPTLDGDRLYVGGIRDVLVCLNAASGETLWEVDFVKELKTPVPSFGFVCSPLVVDDAIYVQAGASLTKLDKLSGEIVWRALDDGGGMWGSAFSSPVFHEIAGKPQVIVQTRQLLAGVDPADGTVLWQQKVPAFRGMNILTPTVWNDSLFTSSYGGKSFLFGVTASDGGLEVEQVWENKLQGYMSSPVVYQDHAYLHLKNQRFGCIDLASGEEKWITKPFGKYWSMVANGDRLLALDQTGELLHIRMSPQEFDLLSRLKVSEAETWAHLAVSKGQVFVRELNALAAYRWA